MSSRYFITGVQLSLFTYLKEKQAQELVNKIIDEQLLHQESICLSCLYDIGESSNFRIDILDHINSTVILVTDDNSKINNQSYQWSFAIK